MKPGLPGHDGEAACKSFFQAFFSSRFCLPPGGKPGLPGHDGEDVCKSVFKFFFFKILSSSWREVRPGRSRRGSCLRVVFSSFSSSWFCLPPGGKPGLACPVMTGRLFASPFFKLFFKMLSFSWRAGAVIEQVSSVLKNPLLIDQAA